MDEFKIVPLDQIVESKTNPRRHFDKAALEQLAENIRERGVLVPLLLRPNPGSESVSEALADYELVAGARRFRAATTAGLTEVPARVLPLSDSEALEVQVIENLQREDVHELDEAIGYEALVERGYTVDQIAAKVGKDRSYIYKRMKLCSLGKKGRAAFFAEKLEMSVALLLARIPVESLQEKALDEVITGAMSFKEASHHLKTHYMLLLDQAPFPVADAQLLKGVGACGSCPKNTGNQGDLFGEVHKGDLCTDLVCFNKKRDAQWKLTTADAAAAGRKVLSDKEAKQVFRYGDHHAEGHVELSRECWEDPRRRTFGELLGDKAAGVVLARDSSGKTRELVRSSDLPKLLKDAGHKFSQQRSAPSRSSTPKKTKAAQPDPAEVLREKAEGVVVGQLVAKAEKLGPLAALRVAINELFVGIGSKAAIAMRRGLKGLPGNAVDKLVEKGDLPTLCGLVAEIVAGEGDGVYKAYGLDFLKLDKLAIEKLKAEAAAAAPAKSPGARVVDRVLKDGRPPAKSKPAKKPAGPLARKAKGKAKAA